MRRLEKKPSKTARRTWARILLARFGKLRLAIFAAFAVAVLAAGIYSYSFVHSGELSRRYEVIRQAFYTLSAEHGLAIKEIYVDGRHFTAQEAIIQALGAHHMMPILAFDIDRAQSALLSLPWVKNARIERRLPGTILVSIQERKATAIWQNKGALNLVDISGTVILDQPVKDFESLPVIVGADAPSHIFALQTMAAQIPDLAKRLQSAVRVGQRRWDLHLTQGLIIKLPERNPELAMKKLAMLHKESQMLDKDYAVIDLRIEDRLFLQSKQGKPLPASDETLGGEST